jgi:hypothetical protein
MKGTQNLVSLCALLLALGLPALGADVYIAQNTSGSNSGVDCADAHSVLWFNANASGGNTYHLCGTFTGTAGSTMLTPPSGSAGNVLTILFEPGAVMTAPYWGGRYAGAITLNTVSYVTIDGGTNGLIQNTANGTLLANQQTSQGIAIGASSHIEVKNLTIRNIYANNGSSPSNNDTGGQTTSDIYLWGSQNYILIHNNTLNNARSGIRYDFDGATASNIQFYNNSITDHCWHIVMGGGSGGENATGVAIYGNTMTGWMNWQCPSQSAYCNNNSIDLYHTDGVIVFEALGDSNTFAPQIYNNYIYGDLGQGSATGFIFCTYGGGSGASAPVTCKVFNNLLVQVKDPARTTNNGPWAIVMGGNGSTANIGPNLVVNNTIIGWASTGSNTVAIMDSSSGDTIENNLVENFGHAVETYWLPDPTVAVTGWTEDYNVGFNVAQAGSNQWAANQNNGHMYSYATWQGAGYGYEAHGSTGDPQLDNNYQISSTSSSAYHKGINLTSLGLTALNRDKAGIARPASGAWDAGAYQLGSGSTSIAPPTGLTMTVF